MFSWILLRRDKQVIEYLLFLCYVFVWCCCACEVVHVHQMCSLGRSSSSDTAPQAKVQHCQTVQTRTFEMLSFGERLGLSSRALNWDANSSMQSASLQYVLALSLVSKVAQKLIWELVALYSAQPGMYNKIMSLLLGMNDCCRCLQIFSLYLAWKSLSLHIEIYIDRIMINCVSHH